MSKTQQLMHAYTWCLQFSEPPGNYTQPPVNQVIAAIIQTMDMCYHAGARRSVCFTGAIHCIMTGQDHAVRHVCQTHGSPSQHGTKSSVQPQGS